MTEPTDPDLIALATPYALHAVPEAERADIERQLAAAPPGRRGGVRRRGPRRARDDGGGVGGDGRRAAAPLRDRLLAAVSRRSGAQLPSQRAKRWRTTVLAAAAALAIGLGALGVGIALRPAPTTSTAEQVFAAPDVRTVSGEIPSGGTATLVFSHEKDAGVLVMNNVPPPQAGHRLPDVAGRR